jgi:EAL domain-containing protein (putative c-di-GMP-specific phosphodiesterase class I)
MTAWLLKECMRECARWQSLGLAMDVSINLSAINLTDPTLIDTLLDAARSCGLAPSRVNLELTESCFMDSTERALEIFRRIHQHGFKMSIDDFGTGFSSLSYLKNLPVHELKIDQTFIRKLLDSKSDQAIVTSTIELAHNFGLSVVAEGIEDEDTAAWLKAHECDVGQGYCYARPMPAEELVAFAQARAMRVHKQAAGPLDSYT